ncbi:MAG: ATP-binding cassette domain-containing protein [Oscillospiraceae bacterium]
MNIIEVKKLKKLYGTTAAVDGISFSVGQGELFGFLGVNGAGKSTTINMLSTLLAPTDGSAEICGLELGKDDSEIRSRIGIVYQQNCLDGMLSVEENLMFRGMLYGKSRSDAKKRYSELCSMLSIDDIGRKKYRTLSGGQKRRCEIAAALMHTPEILFLDEPTTGLDPATRKDVWQAVEKLRSEAKMTVFLTTHYMEEAAAANNIVIIEKGRICASGTPFELKEKYAKDTLRLYSDKSEGILKKLLELGIPSENVVRDKNISVFLGQTTDAIPVLNAVSGLISGFEVIQGTMDDVFLNAAGASAVSD